MKHKFLRKLLKVAEALLNSPSVKELKEIERAFNSSSGARGTPAMGKALVSATPGVGVTIVIPFLISRPNRKALSAAYGDTHSDMEQVMRAMRKSLQGLHPNYKPHSVGKIVSGFALHLTVPTSMMGRLKKAAGPIGTAVGKAATAFRSAYKARLREVKTEG